MLKPFTVLQLFSLTDGRLSTGMDDVYDMLNHITDSDLYTHALPGALQTLREAKPKWFEEQQAKLKLIATEEFNKDNAKDVPFTDFINVIKEKYNETIQVPQLKDEMTTQPV